MHGDSSASEKISGAVDESGSTPLFSALRTVQGKFDKVGIDKDASGEFTHNARPIRVIRGEITEAIDTLMSYIRSSVKHVPIKFESVVIALNEMIDRFAANQHATETREENAEKTAELTAV